MNYIVIILVAVATSMVSSLPAQNPNTRLRFMRKRSVSSNLDFDYEEEAFLPTTITTTTQTSTTVIARTIPTKKYPPANQGNSTVEKRPKNVSTKLDFGTELTATTVTKPTMPTTTTMSAKTTTTELLTTTKLPPTTTTMREFTTISSVPRTKTSTDFENDNSNTHHTITTTTIQPTIMTIDSTTTRAVVIKEPDEVSKDTVILTSSTVPSILQTESPTQSKKESFNTDPTTTASATMPSTTVMRELNTISSIPQTETPSQSKNENFNTNPMKTIITTQPTTIEASTTSAVIENKPDEVSKHEENTMISTSSTFPSIPQTEFPIQSINESSSSNHTCDPGHTQASSSVLNEIGNLCNATVQEAPNKDEPTHIKIEPYDNNVSPEDNAPTSTILPDELNTSQNKGGVPSATQSNILDQVAESCFEATDEPNDKRKKCTTSYTTEPTTNVMRDLSTISSQNENINTDPTKTIVTVQPTTSIMIENKPKEVPKDQENTVISTSTTISTLAETTPQSREENSSSSHTCDPGHTQASSSVLEEIGNLCNATVQEAPNKNEPTHIKIDPYDNIASPEDNAPTSTILPNELNTSQNKGGDTIVTQPNILDQIAESCHETTDEPNDNSKKCKTSYTTESTKIVTMELSTISTTVIRETSSITTQPTTIESSTTSALVIENKPEEVPKHEENIMISTTSTMPSIPRTESTTQSKNENSSSSHTCDTSNTQASSSVLEEIGNLCNATVREAPNKDQPTHVKIDPYDNNASPEDNAPTSTILPNELNISQNKDGDTIVTQPNILDQIAESCHETTDEPNDKSKKCNTPENKEDVTTTLIHTESSTMPSMVKETKPNTSSTSTETTVVHTELPSTSSVTKETSAITTSSPIQTIEIHTELSTMPSMDKETSPNTASPPIETTVIHTELSTTPSIAKETSTNTSSTSIEITEIHTESPTTSSVTKDISAITTSTSIETTVIHTESSTTSSMAKESLPNTASPIVTTQVHTESSSTTNLVKETSPSTSSTSIEITEIHTESSTTSSMAKETSAITTSSPIETTVIHTESSSSPNLVKETSPSTSSTSIETAVIHTEPSTTPNIAKETSPNTSSSPIETTVIQTESSTNSNEVSVQKENIPENGATKLPEQNVVISTTFGNEVTKNDTVFIPGESTTTIAPSTISSHSNANQAVNENNNNQNEKEQGSTTVDPEKDSTRTFKNSISVTFSLLFIILLSNYFH